MFNDKIEGLCSRWSGLTREMIESMKPCDCRYGVIFESDDASARQPVAELARFLTQTILTFDFATNPPTEEAWAEQLACVAYSTFAPSLFGPRPEKPCIVAAHLDRAAAWVFYRLKALLDEGARARPFNCLATVQDVERIPDWLRDHFQICRNIGSPKPPASGEVA